VTALLPALVGVFAGVAMSLFLDDFGVIPGAVLGVAIGVAFAFGREYEKRTA